MDLVQRVVAGDRVAAARLISLIENGAHGVERLLQELIPSTGQAHVVGVTGSPGSGKSTLVGRLARELRSRDRRVGIIAVDPTSPFTGGALLGDRVRMQNLTGDPGSSSAAWPAEVLWGGLSRATADVVKVLDAFGCQVILVETVGVGQGEVEIARTAHSTLVVEVPGMGDGIQLIKAGILEVADLFVVNKADRVRADQLVAELRSMIEMKDGHDGWVPPVLKTVATTGSGVGQLADDLEAHICYLKDSGLMEQRRLDNALRELAGRRLSSRSAARELVSRFRRSGYGRQGGMAAYRRFVLKANRVHNLWDDPAVPHVRQPHQHLSQLGAARAAHGG
ncbi:MAG: methylmalonyl Co-A mutase-associated GTPase MeaB [Chloroflexota bacterium]